MAALLKHQSLTCGCGQVRFTVIGEPIIATSCYCADCRKAAAEISALPGALQLAEADGGTECLLYRKDRIACTTGQEHLTSTRLDPRSATTRLVADCCNSAMAMAFDDSRHWVSAYRDRFNGAPPPVEARICLDEAGNADVASDGIPRFKGYPARMMLGLIGARLAMTFNKGETIDG